MTSGKLKAPVLVFFWFEIRSNAFSQKLDASTACGVGKLPACLLQAAEIPRHYPSSRIRGECGKRCSKILRRRDGGKLGGNLDDGIARYRGFGLSKISKFLADMACATQGDLQDTPEVVRLGRVNCDHVGLGS